MKSFHFQYLLLLPVLGLLTACQSSDPGQVPMPPKPPPERIQSVIFPENTRNGSQDSVTEEEEIQAKEIPALPEGVELQLNGKKVDYTFLENLPPSEIVTVTVLSKPSTPYKDVSAVMDQLHEMGFMITFRAKETP